MPARIKQSLRHGQRRSPRRWPKTPWDELKRRRVKDRTIPADRGDKTPGLPCGGRGLSHPFVQQVHWADALDRERPRRQRPRPEFESDPVLTRIDPLLAAGNGREDIERRRPNEP